MQHPPRLVRDLMTSTVVTLGRNDALRSADDIMRLGRIRHLPIVDEEGKLVGIVSQRDLFHSGLVRALGYGTRAHTRALDSLDVKEAMHTEVVTLGPSAPLAQAAKLMLERKIGCVVIVEDSQVVGILTESDFVRLALEA